MTRVVTGSHIMKTMQLKDAKAKFSAVVDSAAAGEAVVITRHGKAEAVVVSMKDYEKIARKPSLGELLMAYPGEPGDIERPKYRPATPAEF